MKKTITIVETVRTLQDMRNLIYACASLTSSAVVSISGNTVTVVGPEKDVPGDWGR